MLTFGYGGRKIKPITQGEFAVALPKEEETTDNYLYHISKFA
jgi:hypothetical protein